MTLVHDHRREQLAVVKTIITHKPSDMIIAAVDLWVGLALLVTPGREDANTYYIARQMLPLRVWGAIFIAMALLITYTVWCRKNCHDIMFRQMATITRAAGPGLYTAWSVMFFLAAITNSHASFVATAAFSYLAYRHSHCPVPGVKGSV